MDKEVQQVQIRSPLRGELYWKIAISLFLVYHLSAILVLPNGSSLIGRSLSRYFSVYANTLSFNTNWQFFSPGPAPNYYLEYQIETAENQDSIDSEMQEYPPNKGLGVWSDGYYRRVFGMRFFTVDPVRLERYFVPFLCRQVPGALGVSVQSAYEPVPSIERFEEFDSFKDATQKFNLPRQRFSCPDVQAAQDPALEGSSDGAGLTIDTEGGQNK